MWRICWRRLGYRGLFNEIISWFFSLFLLLHAPHAFISSALLAVTLSDIRDGWGVCGYLSKRIISNRVLEKLQCFYDTQRCPERPSGSSVVLVQWWPLLGVFAWITRVVVQVWTPEAETVGEEISFQTSGVYLASRTTNIKFPEKKLDAPFWCAFHDGLVNVCFGLLKQTP